ncbi:hypothetical protein [Persicobacter psychrovividus]|uniref:Uncharacterized protein n=1 Tax=Persicobacter psychrovividus TaxID=387638 RepID=A0ABN6LGJ4_9BACT|nr:hypothetical protein PEPS_43560 [Persicobacter psychrovividus]
MENKNNLRKMVISLKEAELLIFNKALLIQEERLTIQHRQKNYSVKISFQQDHPRLFQGHQLLLFSDIVEFECVEADFKLFSSQFALPMGLLKTTKAEVRDDEQKYQEEILDQSALRVFTKLKNVQSYFLGYQFEQLDQQINWSDFKINFIQEISQCNYFQSLPLKGKIPNLLYDRRVWWMKSVGEYYKNHHFIGMPQAEENLAELKNWLKVFVQGTEQQVQQALLAVPDFLLPELPFILGYYTACQSYEKIENRSKNISGLVSTLNKSALGAYMSEYQYWTTVFLAVHQDDLYGIHAIEAIRPPIQALDNALCECILGVGNEGGIALKPTNEITKEERVRQYKSLLTGRKANRKSELIQPEEVEEKLRQKWQSELVFVDVLARSKGAVNTLQMVNQQICLMTPSYELPIHRRTFMLPEKPPRAIEQYLQANKYKSMPLADFVPKNKEVIFSQGAQVAGVTQPHEVQFDGAFELVMDAIRLQGKKHPKCVFILKVNRKQEELHQQAFDAERRQVQAYLNQFFEEVNLIVKNVKKNIKRPSDKELLRLLGQSMEGVRLKDTFIAMHQIPSETAHWLVQATDDFFIDTGAIPKCINTLI